MTRATSTVWVVATCLLLSAGAWAEGGDEGARPSLIIASLEQGAQVRGEQAVDLVFKPADDGVALTRVDLVIDGVIDRTFEVNTQTRQIRANWDTTRVADGRHNVEAVVQDAQGRSRVYRTFVYVRNGETPKPVAGPKERIEITDLDGVDDQAITSKFLVRVRIDEAIGAKWVVIYLNDKFFAMANYPPFEALVDIDKRKIADGPLTVRARVMHPDGSENELPPARLSVDRTLTKGGGGRPDVVVPPPPPVRAPIAEPPSPAALLPTGPGMPVAPGGEERTPAPAAPSVGSPTAISQGTVTGVGTPAPIGDVRPASVAPGLPNARGPRIADPVPAAPIGPPITPLEPTAIARTTPGTLLVPDVAHGGGEPILPGGLASPAAPATTMQVARVTAMITTVPLTAGLDAAPVALALAPVPGVGAAMGPALGAPGRLMPIYYTSVGAPLLSLATPSEVAVPALAGAGYMPAQLGLPVVAAPWVAAPGLGAFSPSLSEVGLPTLAGGALAAPQYGLPAGLSPAWVAAPALGSFSPAPSAPLAGVAGVASAPPALAAPRVGRLRAVPVAGGVVAGVSVPSGLAAPATVAAGAMGVHVATPYRPWAAAGEAASIDPRMTTQLAAAPRLAGGSSAPRGAVPTSARPWATSTTPEPATGAPTGVAAPARGAAAAGGPALAVPRPGVRLDPVVTASAARPAGTRLSPAAGASVEVTSGAPHGGLPVRYRPTTADGKVGTVSTRMAAAAPTPAAGAQNGGVKVATPGATRQSPAVAGGGTTRAVAVTAVAGAAVAAPGGTSAVTPVVAVPTRTGTPVTGTGAASSGVAMRVAGPTAVPAVGSAAPRVTTPTRTRVERPAMGPALAQIHLVAKGENLHALSRKYHVSVEDLMRLNNLSPKRPLPIGRRLVIPTGVLTVNGAKVATDVVPLQHRRGIAAGPLRFIIEGLGGSVSWIGPAQQVKADTGSRGILTITVGSREAQLGDQRLLMDLAAYLEAGRTMVPVRFISEALDVTVEMDPNSGSIFIRSNR